MVLAGTGKEGKTKEVVKDREGKMVGMYVCNICMYVCMYVCIVSPKKIEKFFFRMLRPENRRENFDPTS